MRIDSIIRELKRRAVEHEITANEAYYASTHDIHISAASALRSAITLIESYRTNDDSPTDKEAQIP